MPYSKTPYTYYLLHTIIVCNLFNIRIGTERQRNKRISFIDSSQPNIHPGCISSTGRGHRGVGVTASPTSTHTAQLIGGAISPSLFTSPSHQQNHTQHQQPLMVPNYPVSANLMIGDYVKHGSSSVAMFRQQNVVFFRLSKKVGFLIIFLSCFYNEFERRAAILLQCGRNGFENC